jgi:hypothetical protein
MRMRAAFNQFAVPGLRSAGGGCQMLRARDGWVALNLSRPDDRALLPALTCSDGADCASDAALAERIASCDAAILVAQGRLLGMAIAALDETPASEPLHLVLQGRERRRALSGHPLVVDLSSLWAGPLAARLLGMGGARVIKVESVTRPDGLREGDRALFSFLNQGKEPLALDLRDPHGRDALVDLISRADVVIEASRPRALRQLGIDADALVEHVPGLVWLTITGHGVRGEAANWIGFGDDAAVAGGLSAALRTATGKIGFVGDAIADPLTGIFAAHEARARLATGLGGRIVLSMSAIAAQALDETEGADPAGLTRDLEGWAAAEGLPIAPASFMQ